VEAPAGLPSADSSAGNCGPLLCLPNGAAAAGSAVPALCLHEPPHAFLNYAVFGGPWGQDAHHLSRYLGRIGKDLRPKIEVDDRNHLAPSCRLWDLPGWMVRVTRGTGACEGVVEVSSGTEGKIQAKPKRLYGDRKKSLPVRIRHRTDPTQNLHELIGEVIDVTDRRPRQLRPGSLERSLPHRLRRQRHGRRGR
jgi:hypothetical protein